MWRRARSRSVQGITLAFISIALWATVSPAASDILPQLSVPEAESSPAPADTRAPAEGHFPDQFSWCGPLHADEVPTDTDLAPILGDVAVVGTAGDEEIDSTPPCEPCPASMDTMEATEDTKGTTDNLPGATPSPRPSAATQSDAAGTFRLCGGPEPETERAIEQLISGRNFRARLTSEADGCAHLTITVPPQPSTRFTGGRQSTSLTVSVGSGSGAPASRISVQIVTENGMTTVRIGANN